MLVEIFDVGVAGQEPEQLVDDRLQVQLLGGEHREAVVERKTHLMAEHRARAGAGAVALLHAALENLFHQIEILPHRPPLLPRSCPSSRKMGKFSAGGNRRARFSTSQSTPAFPARGCGIIAAKAQTTV